MVLVSTMFALRLVPRGVVKKGVIRKKRGIPSCRVYNVVYHVIYHVLYHVCTTFYTMYVPRSIPRMYHVLYHVCTTFYTTLYAMYVPAKVSALCLLMWYSRAPQPQKPPPPPPPPPAARSLCSPSQTIFLQLRIAFI